MPQDDNHERRGIDPLILDMHSMLRSLVQEMKDHVKEDDKAHSKLDDVEKRLIPVEDFHGSMKTAGKVAVAALVGIPTISGAIWAWLKSAFDHAKVP